MNEPDAVLALAALAQHMRLRVFRTLVGAGLTGMTPGALSALLDVPASTLSFHLKELMRAHLVHPQREGRHLIYRADLQQMSTLLDYLSAHCCQAETGGASSAATHCPLPGAGATRGTPRC